MDTQKLKAAWQAKNDRLKVAVEVKLDGIEEPLYVRLLKADEDEHIRELRKQVEEKGTESRATPLAIVAMLCHEDGRRLSEDEARGLFEMLCASAPTALDYTRLYNAASGASPGN